MDKKYVQKSIILMYIMYCILQIFFLCLCPFFFLVLFKFFIFPSCFKMKNVSRLRKFKFVFQYWNMQGMERERERDSYVNCLRCWCCIVVVYKNLFVGYLSAMWPFYQCIMICFCLCCWINTHEKSIIVHVYWIFKKIVAHYLYNCIQTNWFIYYLYIDYRSV